MTQNPPGNAMPSTNSSVLSSMLTYASNEEYTEPEVLFSQDGVFSSLLNVQSSVEGTLSLTKTVDGHVYLSWEPKCVDGDQTPEDEEMSKRMKHSSVSFQSSIYGVRVVIDEIVSISRKSDPFQHVTVDLTIQDEIFFPTLHFYKGGFLKLVTALKPFFKLPTCPQDPAVLYLEKQPSKSRSVSMSTTPENIFSHLSSRFSPVKPNSLGRFVEKTRPRKLEFWWEITVDIDLSELLDENKGDDEVDVESPENMLYDDSSSEVNHAYRHKIEPFPPGPQPLSEAVWQSAFDTEGRISAEKFVEIKDIISKGGVDDSLRARVWPFLLGCFLPESTEAERAEQAFEQKKKYDIIVSQWKSFLEEQEENFGEWQDHKEQIAKDVKRTDRNLSMYSADNSEGLQKMTNILKSYCLYNWNLGYIQGMSDLLSPIIWVVEDEAVSFWCFKKWMDRMGTYFDIRAAKLYEDLGIVKKLMEFLDHEFYSYLDCKSAFDLLFMYRWVVLCMKREFEFGDILKLWEILWTNQRGEHYLLFVCLAITLRQRETVMRNEYKIHDILKHMSDLAGCLDVGAVLQDAEYLYGLVGKYGDVELRQYL